MKCNNQYCYWNHKGSCVPETEQDYDNATPNELDCPSSLRIDIEEGIWILHDEIVELVEKRNLNELIEVKKFILDQRKEN